MPPRTIVTVGAETQHVADIPIIIPKVPNYEFFHNMLVYGNHTVDMKFEVDAKETSFVEFQRGLVLQGRSPGMQSLYALDENICTISRHVVDTELICPAIKKTAVGVLRGWKCKGGDSTFTPNHLKQCKCSASEVLRYINGLMIQITNRMGIQHSTPSPGFPVLFDSTLSSCNINVLQSWYLELFKWMDGVYHDFSSINGLKQNPMHGNSRDFLHHRRNFKDRMGSLAIFRCAQRYGYWLTTYTPIDNEFEFVSIFRTLVGSAQC
jgi:hypothetical protein